MIQILVTYHYQLLILDNLRKFPLTASPLIKTSQSQISLNQMQALHMCLSLFRSNQQIKAMTQNQSLRQHQNIQAAHHLASSSYIFNIPQPKIRNKPAPAQAKSSTTSDSIFTSECTTTDPDLKCQLKETTKRLAQLKSQLLQAKERNWHLDISVIFF